MLLSKLLHGHRVGLEFLHDGFFHAVRIVGKNQVIPIDQGNMLILFCDQIGSSEGERLHLARSRQVGR